MTGNRDIERELQAIEAEYASQGGQQAGLPRLRGLRGAIEVEVRRLRAESERLCDRGTLQALRDANDRAERAERERDAAVALLRDVAQSGVSWTTPGYVVAQIDHATWDAVQRIGGGQ